MFYNYPLFSGAGDIFKHKTEWSAVCSCSGKSSSKSVKEILAERIYDSVVQSAMGRDAEGASHVSMRMQGRGWKEEIIWGINAGCKKLRENVNINFKEATHHAIFSVYKIRRDYWQTLRRFLS